MNRIDIEEQVSEIAQNLFENDFIVVITLGKDLR